MSNMGEQTGVSTRQEDHHPTVGLPENNSGSHGAKTTNSSSGSLFDVSGSSTLHDSEMTQQNAAAGITDTARRHMGVTSSGLQPPCEKRNERLSVQSGADKEAPLSSPKPSKSRRDQFCKVFPDIAETDDVIKSYHCAFFRDILLQGFLYITPNWFCFYSKLLGKKCIKIPVSIVTNITKKKTAIIIPNAIRVITDTDKYVFGSLMSRDSTFQVMLSVWQEKRKVLQKSISVEKDTSDINADRDSLVSTNNDASNTTVKDDSVVSSDGSFCSDLESTSHSAERLTTDTLPSPVPTVLKASTDLTSDGCRQTVFRCPLSSQSNTATVTEKSNQSVPLKSPFTSVNDLANWILNFPRTCLFLTISTILVLFLLLSAMLLAYKLINLQMQLAKYVGWSYRGESTVNDAEPYREMLQDTYVSRHDFHVSNVEKIHVILESHVEVLNKVNQVLKELHSWAVNSCSPISPSVEKS